MKQLLGLTVLTDILSIASMVTISLPAQAKSPLSIVYPPPEHQTVAEKIFFIGTAPPQASVFINGKKIENRSVSGHFAPSLPLKIGENIFKIRYEDEETEIKVTRNSSQPEIPEDLAFGQDSLIPDVDIARLPNEPICLSAVAPKDAKVSARIGKSKIVLLPQVNSIELPPNSAVLTMENQPINNSSISRYQGCTTLDFPYNYGKPIFELEQDGEIVTQKGRGKIQILSPKDIKVVEVIADAGVSRTGASNNYSRLTPLPKGSRARVTGKEGEWLRLDYGAWIKAAETEPVPGNIPPQSTIRGIIARQKESATEIIFPLQLPVPVEIEQKEDSITLSLHNTIAQTDTILLDSDPLIKRLDWQQVSPTQIDYTFELNSDRQWGYDLHYEGTSLIFSLRHPPKIEPLLNMDRSVKDPTDAPLIQQPLNNIFILLDPGHGGKESGSKGHTGYPEKDVNLLMAKLVEQELIKLGAKVYLTREEDVDVSLEDRVKAIDQVKPDLAISIHYNALPDSGDAENTQGISTFWYNTQAHAPAIFLHDYLVNKLNRPDAGTFWNNLALTRPHTAPSILLELGFMINPQEFEWITNSVEQRKLSKAIAQGIKEWFASVE
ncbi:N-acetylmuramoyl-L-alanine amidase [Waterburya agarophytonicola K14]|uniref:N-acetylmuramoyl-L-alanine amidase n=1 Tax=Waterburya agarophytonicola KI4 TaxID=2874699 RepID=A0A964BSF9_9CYAN|nr:N-acetylmuramoyl-L-alanine amidase [Waterburya agarophytonicola]MCC0178299.1 N-acetylmuramoyl-L-alanine amidase [Waterburya agarophytonicola KI4]